MDSASNTQRRVRSGPVARDSLTVSNGYRGSLRRCLLELGASGDPGRCGIVADSRLDACVDAAERLDSNASEALHDLRVSLRRLRTWLRAFRPFVDDTVGRKSRRRLRRLVRSTNSARDLEVWSIWIAEQDQSERRARVATRYVLDLLNRDGDDTNDGDVAGVRRRLPKLEKQLRVELATYSLHTRAVASSTDASHGTNVAKP